MLSSEEDALVVGAVDDLEQANRFAGHDPAGIGHAFPARPTIRSRWAVVRVH